ncbi:MAG TPA: hypothetical protein VMF52_06335 [Steroidobacteraceae bacterium]|nr:hypothetical protein [Steroidobacteraceae bacterium]
MLTLTLALLAAGCATKTPAPAAGPGPAAGTVEDHAPIGQTKYKWTRASEGEVAAALEKKFQEAAKSYVQLKRDDQLMFCKKYREMGSNIRTLHCITEAELRRQVEDSDQLREQMRNKVGKCTLGPKVPCGAGAG